ncbi:MAG: hypothetical protein J6N44_01640, partial [Acidaminococcaceae bacterium]|nr:hypothetical protein [Acidaminococcaceae bacterium]
MRDDMRRNEPSVARLFEERSSEFRSHRRMSPWNSNRVRFCDVFSLPHRQKMKFYVRRGITMTYFKNVVKRNGITVPFDEKKIENAIAKAFIATGEVEARNVSTIAGAITLMVI